MIFLCLKRLMINRLGKTISIQFTDNSKEVLEAMRQATVRALEKNNAELRKAIEALLNRKTA